jgi:uncharacterized protein with HEPN domain
MEETASRCGEYLQVQWKKSTVLRLLTVWKVDIVTETYRCINYNRQHKYHYLPWTGENAEVDKVISSYSVISKLHVNSIMKFETGTKNFMGVWKHLMFLCEILWTWWWEMIVTIKQVVVVWSGARLLFTTGLPDISV